MANNTTLLKELIVIDKAIDIPVYHCPTCSSPNRAGGPKVRQLKIRENLTGKQY
jgi:hypothetical protein